MIAKIALFGMGAALLVAAPAPPERTLRAGAARVDITPPADSALPMIGYAARAEGHKGIHDPLFVRALVLEDGQRQAAIVSCELLYIPATFWERMTARIAKETGIEKDAILLAAVHTHGAPALQNVKPEFAARWSKWMARMEDRLVDAVRQAKANLQPARAGFGTGKAYVNTNRRARWANGGWGLGVNPEGPSDKTVGVVKFETAAGKPLAILINYGVHGTVMGEENYQITGDLPGAASSFVEQRYGDAVVAPWTSGASGDQNAIYGPFNEFRRVASLGQILGEEVARVADSIQTSPHGRIRYGQRLITCPGRRMAAGSVTDDNKISFVDGPPAMIRLSLLMLNQIAFAGVSGEVLTPIGERLKQESPFSRTLMVTHCNGASGYIPDDAAYRQVSYEIWTTPLKPGCAEKAIVDTFRDMMEQD